ncbi:hypothetical protein KBB68_03175 [Candidatus Babeliales bacterium]|nr:hypothetical protein [Candidatus Babeliales bacterium]
MKSFILGFFLTVVFTQNIITSKRYYYATPEEEKFIRSLHANYDPFKDVRLNDKRPTSSLPLLTAKNLKEHKKALNTKLYEKNNPVPPIILDQLKQVERKKWTQDPRYAQFMK